jgi:hypothetical protein
MRRRSEKLRKKIYWLKFSSSFWPQLNDVGGLAKSQLAGWLQGSASGISQPIEEWGLIPIRLRANKRSIAMDCGPIVTIDHVAELRLV